ncbi:hypothetical protein IFM89_003850 [Coptis chinensis]|uniref:Gnk2-homologous domain-containing protein n=1 Tax=Coptis chinensis TaxID=261450 RepID=A0A835IRD4_9MAGN|nr:hypothetical protein IFM89_003850 [Coptis chinensis]
MMYCMEYIHDGNLGSHKNGRRVIMNEDIESAHPMDKKGKQYVLPNIEYQQVRKWVLMHSPENVEWEDNASNGTCQNCVSTAAYDVKSLCLMNEEAIVWEENCQLRYSNESFFGIADISSDLTFYNMRKMPFVWDGSILPHDNFSCRDGIGRGSPSG